MSKMVDAFERLMFGATAQERADMIVELASRRMEERIVAALEADEGDDEPAESEAARDA